MSKKISLARFVVIMAMLVTMQASAQQWTFATHFGGNSTGFTDQVNTMCTDAAGNVYVTGNFNGTINFGNGTADLVPNATGTATDGFVAKFNQAGLCQWAIRFGGPSTDVGGLGIVTNGTTVYVTGQSQFSATDGAMIGSMQLFTVGGSGDGVVFALNAATGSTIWAHAFGGFSASDRGQAICMDNAGHIYISGVFFTRNTSATTSTAYFGAIGNFPRTVQGNISQSTSDLFVAQLNATTGNFSWVSTGGAGSAETPSLVIGNDNISGSGIAFLPIQNQLVIAGSFANADAAYFSNGSGAASVTLTNKGAADICILRMDLSGNFLSGLAAGGPNPDEAVAVSYDANTSAVYINGYFNSAGITGAFNLTNSGSGDDLFYARYNPGANTIAWANHASGSGNDFSFANAPGTSGVYVTGRFQNTISFPGAGAALTTTTTGDDDVFMAKIDPATGNALQLATAGSTNTGTDEGLAIAVSANNDIWVGGTYAGGTLSFMPSSPPVAVTGSDIELFIARYNEGPQILSSSQTNVTCNGGADGTAGVTVVNGQAPYAYSWSPSGGNAATATALGAGTYTVLVTDAHGATVSKQFTITQPVLTAVASVTLPANGTYKSNDVLHFTVNYNANVVVNAIGGTPYISITLNTGGTIHANYVSGSGTSSLTFGYTVAATDQDPDGITIGTLNVNGGTIHSAGGCNANNTLNNLPSVAGILIQNLVSQTITFNAMIKTYADPDFNPNATASSGLPVTYSSSNTAVATIVAGLVHIVGVGITTITASQPGNSNYLPAADVQQPLTVDPRNIIVTAVAKSKAYGEADPVLEYFSFPALFSGDAFTGALNRATGENAGTYAINQGTLALSSNYTITYTSDNLTITPKAITVTAAAKNKIYGDADPALTYTNTPALIPGDAFTGALNRATGENAGTYAINQGTLALSSNYTITYTSDNLTITPKAISVIATAKNKIYGDADPTLTYTNAPALIPGDAFTGALNRATGENAGTYAINQGTLALSSNYTITYTSDNLTITPKAISVTATAKNKIYGDADPALTYTNIPALVTGDVFTGALSRTPGEKTGSYAIVKNTLALNSNYRLTYVAANLVINKALLTVTANDKTVCLGDAVAPVAVNYTGFKNGESTNALSREPSVNIPPYNAAGNYVLTPSGGTATNYNFSYISGQLTVLPLPTGSIMQTKTGAGVPAGYQLAAPSGAVYTWNTGETTGTITVRSSGDYSVKVVNQQGCSKNFTVQIQLQTLSIPNTFSPNGDGINDYWLVPELRNYPSAYVTVVDRDGQVVFESRSFTRWDGKRGGRDLPAGVYFYRISTITAGTYTGWLNLVR